MPDLRRDEGAAMITVMLISMVMTLLAAAALTTAHSALVNAGARRAWEQAIHLAEAAASEAMTMVSADSDYSNHASFSASPTEQDVIDGAASLPVDVAREGEYAYVVPDGQSVAFGVGYVPTRADADAIRVARVDFEVIEGAEARAFLARGDLRINGSADVTGLGGSVHSNEDLVVDGSAVIEGDATATATFSLTGSATVGGASGGGYPAEAFPNVDPSAYRDLTTTDLCPDATVRATAATPCTGAILGTGLLVGWNGWRYVAGEWRQTATTTINGGFYVYQSNAAILADTTAVGGTPWLVTIVVDALEVGATHTNGDLRISGDPLMRPWSRGVVIVAERDVWVSGIDQVLEGLVAAGEQVKIEGGGTLIGSVVADGSADTAGSAVASNLLTGSSELQAEFGAPLAVGGVRTVRWSEL